MSSLLLSPLFVLLGLLLQALALKISLGFLGQSASENRFSRALGVTVILSVALFLLGWIPLIGWLLKPFFWLMVIMIVYRIGFMKTLGVALVQFFIQAGLKWLLSLIGISAGHLML